MVLYFVLAILLIESGIQIFIINSIGKKLKKRQEIAKLKDYEIDQLKWSYIQMGKYIDKFNLTELSDLSWRIENELKDIEIKKNRYLKYLGIKEGEDKAND